MTKEQVLRLLELRIEAEEREAGLTAVERQEYDQIWAVLDAWDPEAPPDESAELAALYENLYAASAEYCRSLAANTRNWSDLCRYWHDRAIQLEAKLKTLGEAS